MSAKDYGWAVGMEVFVVLTNYSRNVTTHTAKITKVGRRWVTFGEGWREGRFDAETMYIDGKGYTSPGRVYASESEYLDSTERHRVWTEFRNRLDYRAPEHLTTERIKEIISEVIVG